MRALLVPVKAFTKAKDRLSAVLDDETRAHLARELAALVLGAAGDAPTFVACDDDEVADWAVRKGATVLWTPGLGLSGAVTAGVARLGERGFEIVVVAHSDLPLAAGLDQLGTPGSVTLVPDRRLDGTNVAAVPARSGFAFAYGPGSFRRHRAEADRLGLPCTVVYDSRLASDVDLPRDLVLVRDILEPVRPA
jgi:2-phospho-L-lactate guanylyltransferase